MTIRDANGQGRHMQLHYPVDPLNKKLKNLKITSSMLLPGYKCVVDILVP